MSDLLLCPFCGSADIDTEGPCYTQFMCNGCGAATYDQSSHSEAIAAWNRRATPAGVTVVPSSVAASVLGLETIIEWSDGRATDAQWLDLHGAIQQIVEAALCVPNPTLTEHIDGDVLNSAGKSNRSEPGAINGGKCWDLPENTAELVSRKLGTGVDSQVVLAALDDGGYPDNPAWLWRNHETNVTGFGRWSKEAGQAAYIRADLVIDAILSALSPRVKALEIAQRWASWIEDTSAGEEDEGGSLRAQFEADKSILLSALASAQEQVKAESVVRALKWKGGNSLSKYPRYGAFNTTLRIHYSVKTDEARNMGVFALFLDQGSGSDWVGGYETLGEAKAAAQADYERRILSALSPTSTSGGGNGFARYRRKQIAELRPWTPGDDMAEVSVSSEDRKAGSPKAGDMIARNPKNHADQWLVAAAYFADNFEPVTND